MTSLTWRMIRDNEGNTWERNCHIFYGGNCSWYFLRLNFLCNVHLNVTQNKYWTMGKLTKPLHAWQFALLLFQRRLFSWKLREIMNLKSTLQIPLQYNYLNKAMICLIMDLKYRMTYSLRECFFFSFYLNYLI